MARDPEKAIFWYSLAAESGDVRAQYNLATLYLNGVAPMDAEKAAYWYGRAADAGDGAAMYQLAVLFEEGRGVKQSYRMAEVWYEKADRVAREKIAEAEKRPVEPVWQRSLSLPEDLIAPPASPDKEARPSNPVAKNPVVGPPVQRRD